MAVVTISLDVDAATGTAKLRGFSQQLKNTGQDVFSFKGAISSIFQGLGQGVGMKAFDTFFGALKSGFGMVSGWVSSAGDFAGSLLKVESALSLDARAQQILIEAGKDVGVSFEEQTKAIGKMAKVLDEHPEKLKRIGMSYEEIKTLSPERQFEEIGKKIASIEDPMRRVAVAQEFFGKGAQEVMPLFNGALETARENVDKFGLAMDEKAVKPLDDLFDTVGLMGSVWEAFTRNIAGVIAQSEPLQILFTGILDLMGRLSKSTQTNTTTWRSFIDDGVVYVAQGLVTLVDVVQKVMDYWDGARLLGRALYTVVIDLALAVTKLALAYSYVVPGGALLRDTLKENIMFLQSEKDAQAKAADAIIEANTKRANALSIVRGEVDKLAKAVEAGIGKSHGAADADEKHGAGLKVLAGNAEEAAKALETAWLKANAELASDEADKTREWQRQYKERTEIALRETERILAEEKKAYEEEARMSADAHDQVEKDWQEFGRAVEEEQRRERDEIAKTWSDLGDNVGAVTDLLEVLGFSSDSALVKLGRSVEATSKIIADATARGYYTIGDLAKAAAAAYKGGSALGGAASGAMIGLSMGGPIGALIGGAAGGLLGLFGGKSQKKAKQDEAVQNAIASLDQLAQRLEKFKAETLNSGVAGVNNLMGYLASKTDLSAERMQRMGTIGFGVFQMLRNSGMGIVEAMNAMGPAFDAAIKAGADGFGAKFAELAAFRQLVLDNADLVTAAESIGDVINAYRTSGMLTQQMFNEIIGENRSLIEDMLAQGFTLDQALAVNAKSLYAIYKAQKDLGLTVDETTQKYIDQAEASGLFENMKDPMEELVAIQKIQLEIMAALVKVMGGALPAAVQAYIDKLNAIPTSVNTNVHTNYSHSGDSGGGDSGGDSGGDGGTPSAAMGGISMGPQLYRTHGTPSNPEVIAPVSALIRGIGQAVAESAGGGAGVQVGQIVVYVPEGVTNAEAFGERVAVAVVKGLKDNTKGMRDVARAYV